MAGRAIFKAALDLGGITVPVKLYSAIRQQRVSFHLLHDQDSQRLSQEMVCIHENKPVPREEQLRGFEVEPGRYVLLADEELARFEPETTRRLAISAFVDLAEIDPRYFDRPYYLGPDGSDENYAALMLAIRRTDKTGICSWSMRKRRYIAALRPSGNVLCLFTLRFGYEIIPADSLEISLPGQDPRQLKTARFIIDELTGGFEPDRFRNDFQDKLRKLVEDKARGIAPRIHRRTPPRPTESDQLEKALQASLAAARKKKDHGKNSPRSKSA